MIVCKAKKLAFRVDASSGVSSTQERGESEMRLEDGSRLLRMPREEQTLYRRGAPRPNLHPWATSPFWADAIETAPVAGVSGRLGGSAKPTVCVPAGWYALIEPGFVNGVDPIIMGAPPIKVLENTGTPKTAYQFGSIVENPSGGRIPGLLDRVKVPLNGFRPYRRVQGHVVAFFRQFGFDPVAMQPSVAVSSGAGAPPSLDVSNLYSNGTPWLGFCDVFLSTARAASEFTTTVGAFPLTAIEYTVNFNDETLQKYGTRSRLMTGEIPQKLSPAERSRAKMRGESSEDDGQDVVNIATVYILKTGDWGGDPESVVLDGVNEVAFVQHHCFWNLQHAPRNLQPVNLPSMNAGLLLLPLVGRYTFAPIFAAAALESLIGEALSSGFNSPENSGKYWSV